MMSYVISYNISKLDCGRHSPVIAKNTQIFILPFWKCWQYENVSVSSLPVINYLNSVTNNIPKIFSVLKYKF